MESLRENKPLLWSIVLSGLAIVGLLTGSSPEFNEQFGLVEIPTEVSGQRVVTRGENGTQPVLGGNLQVFGRMSGRELAGTLPKQLEARGCGRRPAEALGLSIRAGG